MVVEVGVFLQLLVAEVVEVQEVLRRDHRQLHQQVHQEVVRQL
jgi:hypothetical protein